MCTQTHQAFPSFLSPWKGSMVSPALNVTWWISKTKWYLKVLFKKKFLTPQLLLFAKFHPTMIFNRRHSTHESMESDSESRALWPCKSLLFPWLLCLLTRRSCTRDSLRLLPTWDSVILRSLKCIVWWPRRQSEKAAQSLYLKECRYS